jgi:hypothetical protein
MGKHKKKTRPMSDRVNCFNCEHFIYIGDGDYICVMSNELVVEEFNMPTDDFYSCDGKDFEEI